MSATDQQADRSEQVGSDVQVLATVWPYARPDAWAFALALVITPLVAGLSLLQPWLVKRAIDQHVVPGQSDGLASLGLTYLGAALGAYFCQVIYTVALSYGGSRTIMRLRSAIFRHVLSLSQRFFDGQPTGRLMTRITSDVDSLGDALSAGAVTIVLDVFMVVGVLGTMFWLQPGLTLLTLVMSPILIVAINLVRRSLRRLFIETREALAAVNAFIAERID
ncbi:MAG: ABC transporter ATP-binding protein, partial [Oligoflexia bacterium]|nr:ABC transporter ATP-binding protein [Oligoflexia bacterium]